MDSIELLFGRGNILLLLTAVLQYPHIRVHSYCGIKTTMKNKLIAALKTVKELSSNMKIHFFRRTMTGTVSLLD